MSSGIDSPYCTGGIVIGFLMVMGVTCLASGGCLVGNPLTYGLGAGLVTSGSASIIAGIIGLIKTGRAKAISDRVQEAMNRILSEKNKDNL